MHDEVDRTSKLSVISDVSRESDTYGEPLQGEQLTLLVQQLRSENSRLKREHQLQEERLTLCKQQLSQQNRPEMQELFELQNTVFELKTELSGCRIAQMEELKRVHQLHTKEKSKLHGEFEQRLKQNKEAYNRELNDIKLMIKSKGDERDIIKEQQEKLGLCLEEIKSLERHNHELETTRLELVTELDRVRQQALDAASRQQTSDHRRNRHESEEAQAMEQRISLKTDQIRVIQSELNIQKDLTGRLEAENDRLRQSLQYTQQALQERERASLTAQSNNQPDYLKLFQETKKLNEQLTGEVERCYEIIRKLETEQEEKSRIRQDTNSQHIIRHKSLEEEGFSLRKELSEVKLKLANSLAENRYLQTLVDSLKQDKQLTSKRNSGTSQSGGESSQAELDALIREEATRKELAVKDHELRTIIDELASKNAAIDELGREVATRDETIEHLRRKLLEVQTANMELMTHSRQSIHSSSPEAAEEIAGLRAENQRYVEQYTAFAQQAQQRIEQAEAKSAHATDQLERLQIDLQEVNNWNQQLQQHEAAFKQQRDALAAERDELAMEQSIFGEKIQQMQEENGTLRAACEKILEDRNQLFSQKGQLEFELARTKEAIPRQIEEKISSSEKHSETLLEKIEAMKQSLHDARTAKQQAQDKVKELEESVALFEEKVSLLKTMKEEADRKKQQAESAAQDIIQKYTRQQASVIKHDEETRTLKQELVARKDDFDKLMREHQQALAGSSTHIHHLEGSVRQLQADIANQKQHYEETTKQLFDEQTERYHKLNDSTLRLQADLKRLREDSQLHRSEIALVNKEKGQLFARLERTRQQLTACEERLEESQQQFQASAAKQEQLEEYVRELEMKCNMTEQLNAELQQEVERLQNQPSNTAEHQNYLSLQKELHSVRQTIESLSRSVVAAEQEKTNLVKEIYALRRSSTNDVTFSSNAHPITIQRKSTIQNPETYMYFKPPTNDYSIRGSDLASSPLQFERFTQTGSRVAPDWRTSQQIPERDSNSPIRWKPAEVVRTGYTRSAVAQHRPSPSCFN